jgi:bifunctional UDP-N-acetylglucosamine pyrophosphorylase / glucosamine-1-phosphate N-acetyltransferase
MAKLACVVLAAGRSTRMKSKVSKVLHPLAGRPVVSYPIAAAKAIGADPVVVVRAPYQDDLGEYIKSEGVAEAIQVKPLGTGNALQSAEKILKPFSKDSSNYLLILCGDAPLIRAATLRAFVKEVKRSRATLGLVSMVVPEPGAYGRVLRDLDGHMVSVVEAKEATPDILSIREVNSGIICAKCDWAFKALKKLKNDNEKGEYYLTDLIGCAVKENAPVIGYQAKPAEEFIGIDTRVGLARASEVMRERINKGHMLAGAGICDFRHTNIDSDVKIGADTVVMQYTFLLGNTKVGADCIIENGVVIRNSVIGEGVHIKAHSVIEDSKIAADAIVGPFARIRPDSKVGKGARVGNFVELKKCELKAGAKANHLTYLGDAVIGANANIGCGTITCNYDGTNKHKTIIGDGAFIGSDTQFIAPVRVGKGATIGAGSTITKDVPAESLALSRSDQKVVKGWKPKKKK